MKSVHGLLLKEGRGSRRKLSRTLPAPRGFPVTALAHTQPELSTHSSPHLLCGCSSAGGQGLLPSRGAPLRELGGGFSSDLAQHLYEWGCPLLVLTEAEAWGRSRALTGAGIARACTHVHVKHPLWILLPQQCFPFASAWREESTHLEWSQRGPCLQCLYFSSLGPDPTPSRVVLASEQRRPGSHLALAIALPSPVLSPTKVIVTSPPCRR